MNFVFVLDAFNRKKYHCFIQWEKILQARGDRAKKSRESDAIDVHPLRQLFLRYRWSTHGLYFSIALRFLFNVSRV